MKSSDLLFQIPVTFIKILNTHCSFYKAESRIDRAADAPERIPPVQQFPYQSILRT